MAPSSSSLEGPSSSSTSRRDDGASSSSSSSSSSSARRGGSSPPPPTPEERRDGGPPAGSSGGDRQSEDKLGNHGERTATNNRSHDPHKDNRSHSEKSHGTVGNTITNILQNGKEGGDNLRRAKEQLLEALELLPPEQKKAYEEAQRRCPRLVQIESNFERYLKFDSFDPWAAAKRIADYWEARVEVFGPDRAYLPLVLTGQGALSDEDMEVFRTGFVMALPQNRHGRAVLYHDRARLTNPEVLDGKKRMRCMFYVISALSELEGSSTHGIDTLVAYSNKTRKSTFDLKMLVEALNLFSARQIVPVKYASVHLVMLSSRPIMNTVAPLTVQALERLGTKKPITVVHSRKPLEDVQDDLKLHGFDLEGLPKVPLGGLYTFGCFRRWIDDRMRRERKVYRGMIGIGGVAAVGAGVGGARGDGEHAGDEGGHGSEEDGEHEGNKKRPAAAFAGSVSAADVVDDDDDDPEEALARKRREVDAAYARRKRARKKIEVKVLEAEVQRLTQQGESFRQVGRELESKLEEAERLVQLYEEAKQLPPQSQHSQPLRGALSSLVAGGVGAPPVAPPAAAAAAALFPVPTLYAKNPPPPGTAAAAAEASPSYLPPPPYHPLYAAGGREQRLLIPPPPAAPYAVPIYLPAVGYQPLPPASAALLAAAVAQQHNHHPSLSLQRPPPLPPPGGGGMAGAATAAPLGETGEPNDGWQPPHDQHQQRQQGLLFQELYDILSGNRRA